MADRERTSELPAYLRQIADEMDDTAETAPCSEALICREAAAEIGRLRAEVERLKEFEWMYQDLSK